MIEIFYPTPYSQFQDIYLNVYVYTFKFIVLPEKNRGKKLVSQSKIAQKLIIHI